MKQNNSHKLKTNKQPTKELEFRTFFPNTRWSKHLKSLGLLGSTACHLSFVLKVLVSKCSDEANTAHASHCTPDVLWIIIKINPSCSSPSSTDRQTKAGTGKTWLLPCLRNSRFGRIKLCAVEMLNSFSPDIFGRLSAFLISWLLVCDQVQIPEREAANMCDYFLLHQVELKEWTYFTRNKCTLWTLN